VARADRSREKAGTPARGQKALAPETRDPAGEASEERERGDEDVQARVRRALHLADALMDHLEAGAESGALDAAAFRALVAGLARLVELVREGRDKETETRAPVLFILETGGPAGERETP
jgi:hypothetical protein